MPEALPPDQPPPARPLIFISYSHLDTVWKDRLLAQLKVLESQARIEAWSDSRIEVGDDWESKIQEAMARASIAILLISQHSLTSDYILTKEVPVLLDRRHREGLRFIPVIIESCAWKTIDWLKDIQVYPDGKKSLAELTKPRRGKELAAIAIMVAEFVKLAGPKPDPSGYIPIHPRINISRLPTTSPVLFGRNDMLEQLDRAWDSPQCHILELVAFGGVGKTSLVNKWLMGMAEQDYRGATCVYAESFYSQGAKEGGQASADNFIAAALKDFGDADPNLGSPWDKGRRLADLIRRQRTLLILDGLEPLQYPAGEMKGRLKDPALQTLLKDLAVANDGLVIVTTRLAVDELQVYTQSRDQAKEPSVAVIDLENLSDEAGADLLQHLGVKGPRREQEEAAWEFRGHALALTLLGKYLAVVHEGDIRQRDNIPALSEEEEKGGHARRVMQAYEIWLKDRPELLEILRLMGLFDRPAEGGAIKAVRKNPSIAGLTSHSAFLPKDKWKYAIKALRDLRLIEKGDAHSQGTLDCHPLVREYFGERLQTEYPEAWKEGHNRLYKYFKNQAKEYPDTIEAMAPLYAAVSHGCRAGRHQEALEEVYRRRICHGNESYSTKKLGALAADLAAVAAFFDPPWENPAASLPDDAQSFLLVTAGCWLWGLGRLLEARQPLQAGLERRIARKDWANASIAAQNLTDLTILRGELERGAALARQTLDLAEPSGDKREIIDSQCYLAYVRRQRGTIEEALELFHQAEALATELDPEEPYLYSLRGFWFCDLLLDQGEHMEVLKRADHTLSIAKENQWLLAIGLDHLSLGRAYLGPGLVAGESNLSQAVEHFSEAVDFLRRTGRQDHLVLGLLGRAGFFRVIQDWPQAHRDLEEVLEICQRSGMRLYEADCHLEYARLHLAQGNKEEARRSLDIAKPMVQEMGYHRRDREVQELEGQL